MATRQAVLGMEHASFYYGSAKVFDDVSFLLDDARTALVGENGAGKSTLLKCLTGALELNAGQVIRSRGLRVGTVPQDDTASTPALFLTGKGDLTRDFTASSGEVPAGTAPGTTALKLVPRKAQPDYDWLVLLLDPASLTLRGMVTADAQGGTSVFTFSNLKENVGIPDKAFTFQIPRGVDVITDAGGR